MIFVSTYVSYSPTSYAQEQWKTNHYINMAREALALGETKKWENALRQAERTFEAEKGRMNFSERNNFKLWLSLFWSKYHQFKGTPPAVKNVRQFENLSTFSAYIKKLEKSIAHLQKGMKHIKSYNLMYMQIAQRSNFQQQIYLQASLSQERDLEGQIRSNKIYLAFLKYALADKQGKAKTQKRIKLTDKQLQQLKQQARKARERYTALKEGQDKLGKKIAQAQTKFSALQKSINGRAATSAVLTWTGVAMAVIGAGGVGVGIYFIIEGNNTAYNAAQRQQYSDIGLYTTIGAGGGFVLGLTTMLIGIATSPGKKVRERAVIDSHNVHLDTPKSISLFRPTPSHLHRHLPPHSPNTQTFGSW
ncbi:MAG: hypothetical protein CL920_13880 [Deltaproteobacteria bacterium]|nr:hypothetical protein [Deltaproteobacteria bacterium]|tara:strand:+ start:14650 stop:15735 length:1086 start_codon:yes stop_codon:yes gene_type:complete